MTKAVIYILQGALVAAALWLVFSWIGIRYGDALFGGWLPALFQFMRTHP